MSGSGPPWADQRSREHDRATRAGTTRRRARLRSAVTRLRPKFDEPGEEPDPRFTFANERTFLAWARTGIALIGGGLAAAEVLRFGLGGAHLLVAIPAILLGGLVSFVGYIRWEHNERAMRLGRPLGYTPLVRLLATGIALIAAISAVLVMIVAVVR
jgi:putative membrane protein